MKIELLDKIRQYGFKRLLLAVSGGLDSICLAHYFINNMDILGVEWLGIAHVHHGLREKTADRDAAFVEAFAKAHNIPFFLKKLDGEALKNADGSLEENAREARYQALTETFNETADPRQSLPRTPFRSGDDKKGVIVTAHHAGDQAETMYMRLRRGTTLAGLRGIQESREIKNEKLTMKNESTQDNSSFFIFHSSLNTPLSFNIFRPFLDVTRAELLAYALENNLKWCEDESNTDLKFTRNRVRHEFLPQLEKECPGAATQLCRIAELADKAYGKVMNAGESLFSPVLRNEDADADRSLPWEAMGQHDMRAGIALDKKQLRKVLVAHENADLSEMFRLWLSEKGFRFPINFFYDANEPAHVKIPYQAVYRSRAIVKSGHYVQICSCSSPEEAQKFVSCDKNNKGL